MSDTGGGAAEAAAAAAAAAPPPVPTPASPPAAPGPAAPAAATPPPARAPVQPADALAAAPSAVAPRRIVLRVETVGKWEARILGWVVYLLISITLFVGIALVVTGRPLDDSSGSDLYGRLGPTAFFAVNLTAGGASLGALLVMAAVFAARVGAARRAGVQFDSRRAFLASDAAVVLALAAVQEAMYVVGLAVAAAADCTFPVVAVAVLAAVRQAAFLLLLLWMMVMAGSMTTPLRGPHGEVLWRPHARQLWVEGPGAAGAAAGGDGAKAAAATKELAARDAAASAAAAEKGDAADFTPAADRLLLIDTPWRQQVAHHALKCTVIGVLLVLVVLDTVGKALRVDPPLVGACADDPAADDSSCDYLLGSVAVATAMNIASVAVAALWYLWLVARAFRDHAALSYAHYKLTNIYLRLQLRYGVAFVVALVVNVVIAQTVLGNTCRGFTARLLGSLGSQVAIFAYALATVSLSMPAHKGGVATQELLQTFAWTAEALPRELARRNAALAPAVGTGARAAAAAELVKVAGLLVPPVHGHQGGAEAAEGALKWLGATGAEAAALEEPMFCMETALRLFYWSRLAYRVGPDGEVLPRMLITKDTGLALFGLDRWEAVVEEDTDTFGLLGFGPGAVVAAFRGTATMTNVGTDLKFLATTYPPQRMYRGLPVRCHGGFWAAWSGGGFCDRVLASVAAGVAAATAARGAPPRVFVTGHSLGGALGHLAALQIARAHPECRVTAVTFGAPRLGSAGFGKLYKLSVPDAWEVSNREDPIPKIPATLRRAGHRAVLTPFGDLLLRPSYFERTLLAVGAGKPSEHQMAGYRVSLARFVAAQFVPSKCLPGGRRGAAALAAALDLEATLHVDGLAPDELVANKPYELVPDVLPPSPDASACGGEPGLPSAEAAARIAEQGQDGAAAAPPRELAAKQAQAALDETERAQLAAAEKARKERWSFPLLRFFTGQK